MGSLSTNFQYCLGKYSVENTAFPSSAQKFLSAHVSKASAYKDTTSDEQDRLDELLNTGGERKQSLAIQMGD